MGRLWHIIKANVFEPLDGYAARNLAMRTRECKTRTTSQCELKFDRALLHDVNVKLEIDYALPRDASVQIILRTTPRCESANLDYALPHDAKV